MSKKYKYDMRGVSATKDDVHAAIKNLDKGGKRLVIFLYGKELHRMLWS